MLVLTRQRDEAIMIGDDIEVTVVDIRGDKVRLGINAPKEIGVHRKEVYEAIGRERRLSAAAGEATAAGEELAAEPIMPAGPKCFCGHAMLAWDPSQVFRGSCSPIVWRCPECRSIKPMAAEDAAQIRKTAAREAATTTKGGVR